MGQATGIVGKGALAFAGNNYRSVELFVMNRKIRRIFTCPFMFISLEKYTRISV
jgi:hypothetical protein